MVHSICMLSIQVTWIENNLLLQGNFFIRKKKKKKKLYISGRGTEYRDNPQGSGLVLVALKSELGETNLDYNWAHLIASPIDIFLLVHIMTEIWIQLRSLPSSNTQ